MQHILTNNDVGTALVFATSMQESNIVRIQNIGKDTIYRLQTFAKLCNTTINNRPWPLSVITTWYISANCPVSTPRERLCQTIQNLYKKSNIVTAICQSDPRVGCEQLRHVIATRKTRHSIINPQYIARGICTQIVDLELLFLVSLLQNEPQSCIDHYYSMTQAERLNICYMDVRRQTHRSIIRASIAFSVLVCHLNIPKSVVRHEIIAFLM